MRGGRREQHGQHAKGTEAAAKGNHPDAETLWKEHSAQVQ